jgi:hypothetical protein
VHCAELLLLMWLVNRYSIQKALLELLRYPPCIGLNRVDPSIRKEINQNHNKRDLLSLHNPLMLATIVMHNIIQ